MRLGDEQEAEQIWSYRDPLTSPTEVPCQTGGGAQPYEGTAIERKMYNSVNVLIPVIEIEISRREYPVSLYWEKCPFLARAHFN